MPKSCLRSIIYWITFFSAFVGSNCLGMIWFANPLAGYLYQCDRFGCCIICFLGSTLWVVGRMSTSFVQILTAMYFSAFSGSGACLIFNLCIPVIAKYFKDRLSVAPGIVLLSGSLLVLCNGSKLQMMTMTMTMTMTMMIFASLGCIFLTSMW